MNRLSTLLIALLLAFVALPAAAQVPQGINYQAVARNAQGQPLPNQTISVRMSLITGNPLNSPTYTETFSVTTNDFGLFDLIIGQGNPQTGSFGAIDWANGAKYLKIDVDVSGGTNYANLGTTQLLSVPYAMVAGTTLSGGGDNWGSQTVSADPSLTGNGTPSNPLGIASQGANVGEVLTWNGSAWTPATVPSSADNWGAQFVMTNATLAGDGTASNPLGLASQSATLGQVLKWDGTSWVPGNDDLTGSGPLVVSARISGNGTAGSPLDIAGQGATTGQVLAWNGTSWAPSSSVGNDNWGTQSAVTSGAITGNGLAGNAIRFVNGTANGQVWQWNGSAWGLATLSNTVSANFPLAGNGTSGSPLTLANGTANGQFYQWNGSAWTTTGNGASNGQVLTWNGTAWVPQSVPSSADNWGTQTAVTSGVITGNGTSGNAIRLANGTAAGQVLQWNGTAWATASLAGDNLGNHTATTQVQGTNGTAAAPAYTFAGNLNTGIFRPNTNQLAFSTNGTQRAFIGADGNVGIGTGTPFGALQIVRQGTITNPHLSLFQPTANQFSILSFDNQGSTNYWIAGARPANDATGRFNFFSSNSGGIDVMSLANNGQVGIGTTTPDSRCLLDVYSHRRYAGFFESDSISGVTASLVGVYRNGGNVNAVGVYGESFANVGYGIGGDFRGGSIGVQGIGNGNNYTGNYGIVGVYGFSTANAPVANRGCIGVYGEADGNVEYNYSIYGFQSNTVAGFDYAGVFDGNVDINGTISKSGGTFRIDHPLDPANKFLVHSFVESPDMMNIYNGNATTDANGFATVELPSYFEALNMEFRYQLTVIGTFAQAIIAQEIEGNKFVIQTNQPNVRVSWQVTGVRNDPWARANRYQAEVPKTGTQVGRYLHPELYNQPAEQGIHYWARQRALQQQEALPRIGGAAPAQRSNVNDNATVVGELPARPAPQR